MLKFLADENFDGPIIEGLLLREPTLDLVRAVDVGIGGNSDDYLLQWAAEQERILLTHDKKTIPDAATRRIRAGLKMPGAIVVLNRMSHYQAIDEILTIALASFDGEWENQIKHLPM